MTCVNNILLVANWESNTGYAWWLIENFWVTIADHFDKHGKCCYLIYPKITAIPNLIATSDIKALEYDFRNHSYSALRKMHRLIKQHNIRYIYLTDAPTTSIFYILLRLWGINKIIIHDHTPGDRTAPSKFKKLLKSGLQRTPLITADHFIAVTDFVYKRFIDVTCIPPKKCSCAPNGIVPIDLENIDKEFSQNAFEIPRNRTIIITTGRATYYKGIDFFIECANELINKRNINDLHFLYCGDGPNLADFRSLVWRYKLKTHFTFAGKRTDIRKILPSCHIGFHAATGEVGYSLSILEYMSAGLLTIVPDRPSTSLAITHMENGLLYKPGDLQSAADSILTALRSDTCSTIRKNAIKLVEDKYNINYTNRQLINIMQKFFS